MILQDVKFGINRWRLTGRYALFDTMIMIQEFTLLKTMSFGLFRSQPSLDKANDFI
jgi:hypothetical protein